MKLNLWLMIAAVVALIFGLGFVLIPDQVLSWYGLTGANALNDAGILMTRLFGATLIGFGALDWFAKDVEESGARRAIVIGGFVSTAIGFVVFLIAQLGTFGTLVNALGWVTVV